MMSSPKPLAEQITASLEDVQALLDSNRNLSVAFLSLRLKDLEAETRERFRSREAGWEARIDSLEKAVKTLEDRLRLAGVKFQEMREDVDQVKGAKNG